MLHIIYGTAGTGKTTLLHERLGAAIKQEKKAILLVPEQFSFETERSIYQAYGAPSSLQVEVLTFTRLCNNIFRAFGGLAGTAVTKTARYLLMSVAVQQLQDQLCYYRKNAQNPAFLETLLTACSELKTAGVSALDFEVFLNTLPKETAHEKWNDLSLIYTAYQALLEIGYTDPEDDLIRASSVLEVENYFKDYDVFVDGFTTFMEAEFELLSHIIAQSPEVTFAFTTPQTTVEDYSVFSVVQQAVRRITRQVPENQVIYTALEQPQRYYVPELEYLSKHFMVQEAVPFTGNTTAIQWYPAADRYREIEYVAANIVKLIRQKGWRYHDIAVVARRPEEYLNIIELVFERYNIPFFADKRLDMDSTPLAAGLFAALRAVQTGYETAAMLTLAKSPIVGITVEDAAYLENYCYIWSVRGSAWQADFANNPRGLVTDSRPEDKEILHTVNTVRKHLIEPLQALKQHLDTRTGTSFARGVYGFLEQMKSAEHLQKYAIQLPPEEIEPFLEISAQIWEQLIAILDVFGEVFAEYVFEADKMIELFRLAVISTEIAMIPQTLDQVLLGGADRIRPKQMKAVFVIGANEGSFPEVIHNVGVFSQAERQQLIAAKLPLTPGGVYQSLLERFYAYFTMTLPSHLLYVSYAQATLQGTQQLPSTLITSLRGLFPDLLPAQMQPLDLLETPATVFTLFAQEYEKDNALRATLWDYIKEQQPTFITQLDRARFKVAYRLSDPNITEQLFGKDRLYLSPSRIERYHRCPFSYFIQDGLHLKQRKKVEFSPLESGTMIHFILQIMLQKFSPHQLATTPEEQLKAEVYKIIEDYLTTRVRDIAQLSKRFYYLFKRLCGTMARLLRHLGKEFEQSAYQPYAFELPISYKQGAQPLPLVTVGGTQVVIEGVVDRVDLMEQDGVRYLRVVDYKSGNKDFKLQDVLQGLNLQMLLYLFTLAHQEKGELKGVIPAGVLYMPVREIYHNFQHGVSRQDIEQALIKQWTMTGLLLDEEESIMGMEQELEGVYIPVKRAKNGSLQAKSSLASKAAMGALSGQVQQIVLDMAEQLQKGRVPALPINTLDYPTCAYCAYRGICGYEEGDMEREFAKMGTQQILEKLEQEDEDVCH